MKNAISFKDIEAALEEHARDIRSMLTLLTRIADRSAQLGRLTKAPKAPAKARGRVERQETPPLALDGDVETHLRRLTPVKQRTARRVWEAMTDTPMNAMEIAQRAEYPSHTGAYPGLKYLEEAGLVRRSLEVGKYERVPFTTA